MADDTEDIVQRAIKAAKSGNRAEARKWLSQAIKAEPNNARAWYLFSQVSDSEEQAVYCLNQVLKIQPDNAQAKERLSKMNLVDNVDTIAPSSTKTSVSPASKVTLKDLSARAAVLQSYYNELVERSKFLQTFEDAANWKVDAAALIRLFDQYQDALENYSTQEQGELERAKKEREALPVLKRFTASQAAEKQRLDNIQQAQEGIESVGLVIADLLEKGSKYPSSKAEQKQMLSELRLYKKELEIEKRQTNEKMRQIRTQARQNMTSWTGVSKGFMGDIARYQRSSIRFKKESSLAPHESVKTGIERLLIETERQILLVSHFSGADTEITITISRCAYCGRRMDPNGVCPGCGSIKSTTDL